MAQPIAPIDPARFWRHVDSSGGLLACWPWTAGMDRYGYGEHRQITAGKRRYWRAHRLAFEMTVGPIPDGLVIDHLCRNRSCCNPAHMEPVTPAENTRRGESGIVLGTRLRSREACPNGHPYVEGSYRIRNGRWRVCVECARARRRRWDHRSRAE